MHRCTADDATVHRHLCPEELQALAAHALVGAAQAFFQASTAQYRAAVAPPQVLPQTARGGGWGQQRSPLPLLSTSRLLHPCPSPPSPLLPSGRR